MYAKYARENLRAAFNHPWYEEPLSERIYEFSEKLQSTSQKLDGSART